MTSSYSPTEFLLTNDRAWNLYRHCYTVAHTATKKLYLIPPTLEILPQSIQLLQEECQDPTSTLVTSGPVWISSVKGIVRHTEATLVDIETYANRCERLGDASRAMRTQIWDLCKGAFDGRKMDKLEKQLEFRDRMMNVLLFTSRANVWQQFTALNALLESRCIQIDDLISTPALITSQRTALLLKGAFMTNAEPEQQQWSSVEIDEWLQTSRSWLEKSKSQLSAGFASQGYVDAFKAAWIFTAIIRRHPRLVILEPDSRVEAEALAEIIINQLEYIDATEIATPTCEELQLCDLRIWEMEGVLELGRIEELANYREFGV